MLCRLVRFVHRSHRSLRDFCYTLVLLAGASAVLTYHISRRMPSRQDHPVDDNRQATAANQNDHTGVDDVNPPKTLDGSVAVSAAVRHTINGLELVSDVSRRIQTAASEIEDARIVLEGLELDRKLRQHLSTYRVDEKTLTDEEEEEEEDGDGDGGDDDEEAALDEEDEQKQNEELTNAYTHSTKFSNDLSSNSGNKLHSKFLPVDSGQLNNGSVIQQYVCVDDVTVLPLLSLLDIKPTLVLLPPFNASSSTDYYATVPHHVVVINVRAVAAHCLAETRLAERHGPIGQSNFTLGLGLNRFNIYVVNGLSSAADVTADVTTTESLKRILGLYTLTVYRQPIIIRLPASVTPISLFDLSLSQVETSSSSTLWSCSLQQDCEMVFMDKKPCGLRSSHYGSWKDYIDRAKRLPYCDTGAEMAEWVIPCARCNDVNSCYWQRAVWQPISCSYWQHATPRLKSCFTNKKILFIGDSTNRGMMHYAMEMVNGSLTEWDKTHDTKIYSNINDNNTVMSFAYYPQFWLTPGQRPMFDDTLLQLLKATAPLSDNHNTVLVVGGVHWLSTHHLVVISNVLRSQGLSNVMVIVKTLGAGFHQPVDGVHHLSLTEQQRLAQHNQDIKEQAKLLGFDVVDTFQMTMARYKDFLQGKCACHFHRIKEVLPSFSEYLRGSSRQPGDRLADMPIHYHVEGDINAAYSDILLGRVCGR